MTGRGLLRGLCIAAVVIVGLGAAVNRFAPPPRAPDVSGESRAARPKMAAEQRANFALALRRAGWNCEDAKDVWPRPDTDRGRAAKVLCGPPNGDGVYTDRIFNIVIQPNGRIIVEKGTLRD